MSKKGKGDGIRLIIQTDGAARGNPGPAGIGMVFLEEDGTLVAERKKFIGHATNNVAEYRALIEALKYAREMGATQVTVQADSELMVRQMTGQYKVRDAGLRPLYEEARRLAAGFASFAIRHVPREENRRADELANMAIDEKGRGE
ncbi:MAG: ribonuclease HI family protein [Clostridiales bacterium]|nr:ribonuclease HI family protein [Clostridiales bacterium]